MEIFYVTTPIYYVNDRPHIGHAYCTILADVLMRYHRLFGYETYFLTGVDEHGQKVAEAARKRGIEPQAHCDEMQAHFRNLWKDLDIENDDFIRTTEERHKVVVQEAMQRLWEKGEIYKGEYEGFYSPRVEKFFSAEELVDGRCPESGGEVYKLKEPNYFFRMSKYRDALVQYIQEHPDFIFPESRRREVLGFLAKPLGDLCISRPKSRLSWGIELPFDRDYVTYVWFDALLNYASAIGLYRDEARFTHLWSGAVHLIGKDILTTHSVYWTTMLMALGIPLPRRIVATGWWLVEQTKMSKSLGNVVDPLALKDKYGVDSLRYFLMREMVIGLDASFSEEALLKRHNYDLANDLGNLAYRLARLAQRAFMGKVPEASSEEPIDQRLRAEAEALPGRVRSLVQALRLEAAIEATMNLVRHINRYVTETEPFKLVEKDFRRAGHTVRWALEGLRFCLNLLWPVMPRLTAKLLREMGAGGPVETLAHLRWGELKPGEAVTLSAPPFPRFDTVEHTEPAGKTEAPKGSEVATVSHADFSRLDLRVGTVVLAEPVPKSKKLIRLLIDLGEPEPRQVVAGILEHYAPQDLQGRQVLVVANLEPRKVMGVESRGMILAAGDDQGFALLVPSRQVKPGTKVT